MQIRESHVNIKMTFGLKQILVTSDLLIYVKNEKYTKTYYINIVFSCTCPEQLHNSVHTRSYRLHLHRVPHVFLHDFDASGRVFQIGSNGPFDVVHPHALYSGIVCTFIRDCPQIMLKSIDLPYTVM